MAHEDIMYTSNPRYEYAFCWTIEDFHPSLVVVRGPTFSPIPGRSNKFCFEVQYRSVSDRVFIVDTDGYFSRLRSYLDFKLIDLTTDVEHHTVHGKVVLKYKERNLCEKNLDRIKIEQCSPLMTYEYNHATGIAKDQALSFPGLADGDLTLRGSLIFTGYLTTSIYSISVPKSLENCGDLAKDFKSLYESGFGSDVTVTVGDKLYPAHKSVLSARSVTFAKMFEHPMLESNTNNVIIKDIDPEIFNEFMLFLYTGCLEGDPPAESVVVLYYLAKQYQVKSLYKACVALLRDSLTVDSVCDALVAADLHEDEYFKGMVKAFVRENFFDVVGTATWVEIVSTKPALAREVLDFVKPVSK